MNKCTLPSSVVLGDITVRDGFQHEERFVPTETKQWFVLRLQEAGFKRIEVTNFGNPARMPQFRDRKELLKGIRRRPDVEYTAVTISERSIKEAVEAKQEGWGVDRILMMISTSEAHNLINAGLTHAEHWARLPHWIKWAHDAGMRICGTVSTIWGCPIAGPMPMSKAIQFTKRMLDLGIDDIEHADHDGQATPSGVFDYFSQILDAIPDPCLHVAHFHVTRGWGLANVFAALQAGVTHFESTVGGIGGQPANIVNGVPVLGTGRYYSKDPGVTGLVCTEDLVVMLEGMGVKTGIDVEEVLEIGRVAERVLGRRLRSECIRTGNLPARGIDGHAIV